MKKPLDLTRSKVLRSGAAAAFKDAGGVLGGIVAAPDRDAILFMGTAHGKAVSLPVTGHEQLLARHDPTRLVQAVKRRLEQLKALTVEKVA